MPQLGGGWQWNLNNLGDSIAAIYRLSDREFTIEFRFPEALGEPSDYVVVVWGFRDANRTPSISEHVDILGYARIRTE